MKTQTPRQTTILMVDDMPNNLQALSDMLTVHGYLVQQARDGKTALAIIQETLPDLVLLDIHMPDIDGYEVCQRLKADERTRDIPIMFISALSETTNVIKGFEVGGVDYITKPFQYREVIARVANQLTLVKQRQQIEALRAQDRQYFESLNRMKNQFIRMATHDLRNPLNVILGYTQVLDRLDVADHDRALYQQAVSNIQGSVEKMRTLVTDILDLAQLEAGLNLSITPTSLNGLLEKCLSSFHVIASQENIELAYQPPPENVKVPMDESYMARVVDNLVSNALKYTPAGGRVEVTGRLDNGQAIIQVSDTGMGIPESDLPHLFKAFYRVSHKAYEGVEGSGLGLSIVKTIVERHGGQIEVESTPEQGSIFRVRLPMSSPDSVP